MLTTVDFLRHGEVEGDAVFRGSTDDPLSNTGWQQLNNSVTKQHWDHIISSPLKRCLDFAQHFSEQSSTSLNIDSNWQEISFGDWEGKTAEQIEQTFPNALALFYKDPLTNTPEKAESFIDFQSRINLAWEDIIRLHPNKHILVVTHAGVIRCLFLLLLKLPVANMFTIQVDHASLTRFQCFHDPDNLFISLAFHNKLVSW